MSKPTNHLITTDGDGQNRIGIKTTPHGKEWRKKLAMK